ncbi:MAG: succinate dehydrogenase (quinone) flavoprotein subunit, partial [Acidimicrobiia bacterium]|nr:succinate dehydrogenase (quinone) flavoprotein subunit [Acidimicrobiia bacterium]
TQIHPTCITAHGEHQSKLTLMSESLRNDGRVWVPKKAGDTRRPRDIPESERDYFLERRYPAFGNLVPRDVASRAAKERCDAGFGVVESGYGVYLDFADAIGRLGKDKIAERYGNLFQMYEKITGDDPYETAMRIYPAPHYTMGGLWVDYNLMSTVPGLHVIGEANFSDHGANRLGASALMQGLADGYFVLPYTIGDYFATESLEPVAPDHPECKRTESEVRAHIDRLLGVNGKRTVESFHRELGQLMLREVGMSRTKKGLEETIKRIPEIREEFWSNVAVVGQPGDFNQCLERAGRVADFMEFAELMARDALNRNESCGGHFREEYQTDEGEAKRDDDNFANASVWEFTGVGNEPKLHTEDLTFEDVPLTQRSYK